MSETLYSRGESRRVSSSRPIDLSPSGELIESACRQPGSRWPTRIANGHKRSLLHLTWLRNERMDKTTTDRETTE